MDEVIHSKASVQEIMDFIHTLPDVCIGMKMDEYEVGQTGMAHAAKEAMSLVQHDFQRKSLGQVGDDGARWEELKPTTIKKRLRHSPHAAKASRSLYATLLKKYLAYGMAPEVARRRAKQELEVAHRSGTLEHGYDQNVPILNETGRLLESVSPGEVVGSEYHPTNNQDAQFAPGLVEIRTDVSYGESHQKGVEEVNLPKRQFIPDEMPESWDQPIADAYAEGLAGAIVLAVSGW